ILLRGLIECRAGRITQLRPLPAQTCGDRAHVWNLAGAEAIDVRGAGPALPERTLVLGKGRAAGKQRENQAERATLVRTAEACCESQKPWLHGSVFWIRLATRRLG